jgi:hypothetical protein
VPRRVRTDGLVLLGYVAVAFAYFGWRLADHPGRYILGSGRDPEIFIWAFAWWPHAIETWQNPFYSHAIYAPTGVNLAWTTTVPGLALVFWPLTQAFGPTLSYNVAAMLMPALAAWTAYLLCRHLTRSTWAGVVGGYLFGFSSYELGQELGHLHMTAVFLLPLVALAVVRFAAEQIDERGLTWRLGVLLGLQIWISTEVLVTATIALLTGLVLGYAIVAGARPRLRRILRPLAGASALAAVIGAPLVVYAVIGFSGDSINAAPANFDGDLLNFVVPTHLIALGGSTFSSISAHFRGNDAERGAYLGLPTIAIIGWAAARTWRSATTRLLLALLATAVLLTLGTGVAVQGRIRLWLPWNVIARAPVFDNVLPARLALYCALTAAVIVALWTASRRGWTAWVVPLLAVLALIPAVWHVDYRVVPERWAYFTDGEYKCLPRNQNVAIFPFGARDDSMLWQAESDFWFRMPEGALLPTPPAASLANPVVNELTFTDENPTIPQIISLVKADKVDRVMSVNIYVNPNGTQMHEFGELSGGGGVLIAPACGYPSLQEGIHPTPPHPPTG